MEVDPDVGIDPKHENGRGGDIEVPDVEDVLAGNVQLPVVVT